MTAVLCRIALRNLARNLGRSFVVGFAIFLSALLLLAGSAAFNGAEEQTLRSYMDITAGPLLRAEPQQEASTFFADLQRLQRSFYDAFVVFLLVVIGIGVRSLVRVSLFERIRELGTLRAIGFGRRQGVFLGIAEMLE
jgi:hypothetical protein